MCYLTTVVGSFHGRVLAARLGAEGVIVVLKGATDGPMPFQSNVDVLVPADQLALAREILLADAVDDAFSDVHLDARSDGGDGEDADRLSDGWESDAYRAPLARDEPSDSFSLRSDDEPDRQRSRRLHGMPAAVAVLLVATMIVVAFVASAAH
jgi:hypothetical protein